MDTNAKELNLLKNNPKELIVLYQSLIRFTVNYFVKSGYIKIDDFDDFVQYINEELLKRIEKIRKSYNETTLLKTYFSVIIKNICHDRLRKDRRNKLETIPNIAEIKEPENITSSIIIQQELNFLDKIFKAFHKNREKIILCFKSIFRIPLKKEDLSYYLDSSEQEIENLIETLKSTNLVSDTRIFELLTPIFNKKENKNNSPDSTRKWLDLKIKEFIKLINGDPPRANYSKETFQFLAEKYFYQKMD